MKRLLIILLVALGAVTEASAVLKEKDLEQTLTILQAELEQYNNELTVRSVRRQERTKTMITQLLLTLKQADQNALMLYSQQTDNVFDMTYACQEATKQYREFHGGSGKRRCPSGSGIMSWDTIRPHAKERLAPWKTSAGRNAWSSSEN